MPNSDLIVTAQDLAKIKGGYGLAFTNGRTRLAHRFIYQCMVGPVAKGLHLDHLCRVRCCVNPAHLEPVTPKVNTNRGINHHSTLTHCPKGHEYAEGNVYRRPGDPSRGGRSCLVCRREFWKSYKRPHKVRS